jgi:ribose-phosphate pyrophosphokinase
MESFKIFALTESKSMGKKIASSLGVSLGDLKIDKFSDGELSPNFQESIREHKVFIVGSTHQPHSNIMEMMLTIDAAKRAGASQINCIIPYYGYARQDRKGASRGAIGSKVVANMLEANGADVVITIDLHAGQIEGNFDIQTVNIDGKNIFIPYLKSKIINTKDWVICSPDAGGVVRAKKFSDYFNTPLCVINKRRDKPNSIASMDLVGEVKGKNVVLIDDMVDTAGSLCKASDVLLEKGAKSVSACITHPVLSGEAHERIAKSSIDKLYVSDTIPVDENSVAREKIVKVSCSNVIGTVIGKFLSKESIDEGLSKRLES